MDIRSNSQYDHKEKQRSDCVRLECIREIEGFTVGKIYRMFGCAGEYVQLKNDNKEKVILFEGYFKTVK